MALAAIVENLDNVPEALHGEYVEVEGKFVLDVTEVEGMALENVQGLKSALGKERSSVKGLQSEVNKFKKEYEGVDIDALNGFQDKYETANKSLTEMTDKFDALSALDPEKEAEALAETKSKAAIKRKQTEWQKQFDEEVLKHGESLTAATDRTSVLERQLHDVVVKSAAMESLTKEGVGDNLDLMLPQMLNQIKYEVGEDGFSTYVADGEGNPRVKVDGTNMTTKDLVEELKVKWPSQFKIAAKPGGGKPPGGSGGSSPKGDLSADENITAGLAARKAQ